MSIVTRNAISKSVLQTFKLDSSMVINQKLNLISNKKDIITNLSYSEKELYIQQMIEYITLHKSDFKEILSFELGKSDEESLQEIDMSLLFLHKLKKNYERFTKIQIFAVPGTNKV